MKLTHKQMELLRVIIAGNSVDGTATDLDQILDRIRYETTKASLQFSLRALVNHKLIVKTGLERRRGCKRQVIAATEYARSLMRAPAAIPNPITTTFDEELLDVQLEAI